MPLSQIIKRKCTALVKRRTRGQFWYQRQTYNSVIYTSFNTGRTKPLDTKMMAALPGVTLLWSYFLPFLTPFICSSFPAPSPLFFAGWNIGPTPHITTESLTLRWILWDCSRIYCYQGITPGSRWHRVSTLDSLYFEGCSGSNPVNWQWVEIY